MATFDDILFSDFPMEYQKDVTITESSILKRNNITSGGARWRVPGATMFATTRANKLFMQNQLINNARLGGAVRLPIPYELHRYRGTEILFPKDDDTVTRFPLRLRLAAAATAGTTRITLEAVLSNGMAVTQGTTGTTWTRSDIESYFPPATLFNIIAPANGMEGVSCTRIFGLNDIRTAGNRITADIYPAIPYELAQGSLITIATHMVARVRNTETGLDIPPGYRPQDNRPISEIMYVEADLEEVVDRATTRVTQTIPVPSNTAGLPSFAPDPSDPNGFLTTNAGVSPVPMVVSGNFMPPSFTFVSGVASTHTLNFRSNSNNEPLTADFSLNNAPTGFSVATGDTNAPVFSYDGTATTADSIELSVTASITGFESQTLEVVANRSTAINLQGFTGFPNGAQTRTAATPPTFTGFAMTPGTGWTTQ